MSHETVHILCSCRNLPNSVWVSAKSVEKNKCRLYISYDFKTIFKDCDFEFSDIQHVIEKASEIINIPLELETYVGYNIESMILDNKVLVEGSVSCEGDDLYYDLYCTDGNFSVDLDGGHLDNDITDFLGIREYFQKLIKRHKGIGDIFGISNQEHDLDYVFYEGVS